MATPGPPPSQRPVTAIGFLGTTLDAGGRGERWDRWRPTVALCQHEDLLIERLVILRDQKSRELFERVAADIKTVSPAARVTDHVLDLRNPWDFEEVYEALHGFARQFPFDPEREDYLVHITTGTHVAQICLFLLTESRHLPARLIQTSPPQRAEKTRDIVGTFHVIDLDLSRYDRIAQRFEVEHREGQSFLKSGIATRNPRFNRIIEEMEHVAISTDDPILLTGPTGAGKSLLASRIFDLRRSRRQVTGKFVEVNCATLRGDGAGSALFGHVKGAFTGATSDRAGLLKAADAGMLFLDEIGELGADEQAMLLRAIEEKRFFPLGSDREVQSAFQLVVGTNRDLLAEVAHGRFREDLLARINLWSFRLPGLAERREDIGPNLDYELERYGERRGKRVTFNREARESFLGFAMSPRAAWKANFRDLNAALTRMATLAIGGRITEAIVRAEVERLEERWRSVEHGKETSGLIEEALGAGAGDRIDRFERVQLEEVLRVCRETRTLSEAGRTLFGVSRAAKKSSNDADRLRKYLARFGLDWESVSRRVWP